MIYQVKPIERFHSRTNIKKVSSARGDRDGKQTEQSLKVQGTRYKVQSKRRREKL